MLKISTLFLILALVAGFCFWYKTLPKSIPPANQQSVGKFGFRHLDLKDPGTGIKWNDSLRKHLPANLDTTIIIYDANNTPLKFSQYIVAVFNKDAMIYQDRGTWRLQRKTQGALDTLKRDDAVARFTRWPAMQPDTVKSWQLKFDEIAGTLAQADRVLVLKSKRILTLQRKGKNMITIPIQLGRNPIGRKQFDKDGKTPEGVYDLDCKIIRNDVYYKSILLSYPNAAEKQYAALHHQKPGMSILIHGTKPDKIDAKDWTAGCIALQNNDMDTLFKYVAEGTVIEIRP